jgi:hypothetical protein
LNQLQLSAGPLIDLDHASILALLTAKSVQPFGLVSDPDIVAADSERCFFGIFKRILAIMGGDDLAKRTQGSLFLTLTCSDLTYSQASEGLSAAAEASGLSKYVFVDRSPAPTRLGSTLAATLADKIVAEFPEIPVAIAQLLVPDGKPAALLHYTLREKCECLACQLVREAVYPPKQEVHR